MNSSQTLLDPGRASAEVRDFETALRKRIVGQERAVRQLGRVYQVHLAGLGPAGRPIVNLLLLGPTGSGKTRLVEAAAEVLLGSANAVLKVDCAEFQHSHEIAKLIGSPPGYLGHRETTPMITQEALEEHYTEKLKLSLVLFDEIEKASDALWQLLLGILDKATLTLGDNRRVDFSHSMIFMTSNLGSQEMTQLMSHGLGFSPGSGQDAAEIDQKIYRAASQAARKKFSPEFMNRIDRVIVFRVLSAAHLDKILDIELSRVQERIMGSSTGNQFVFRCTPEARQFLLREGTDAKSGARHLKRAIERHLVFPLSSLIATKQITLGDLITVGFSSRTRRLEFLKEDQGSLVGREVEEGSRELALATTNCGAAAAPPALARQIARE
ncbi:MAG: ATP-dependent Clp protease ATP-binding subunit [Acidobacteriota bacterium]|nr:ATP-dependent Clp protease ATP-binding subunit [Acidobacteriota bacterium]